MPRLKKEVSEHYIKVIFRVSLFQIAHFKKQRAEGIAGEKVWDGAKVDWMRRWKVLISDSNRGLRWLYKDDDDDDLMIDGWLPGIIKFVVQCGRAKEAV